MREEGRQNKREHRESFRPSDDILNTPTRFLRGSKQDYSPVEHQLRLGVRANQIRSLNFGQIDEFSATDLGNQLGRNGRVARAHNKRLIRQRVNRGWKQWRGHATQGLSRRRNDRRDRRVKS